MDKPLLLQMSEEVQEYSKTLTELRLMLYCAVVLSPEMRLQIPVDVLVAVNNGEYNFSIMNKPDGVVLVAEKESVIEVAK